jgi:hypothetical protein
VRRAKIDRFAAQLPAQRSSLLTRFQPWFVAALFSLRA